VVCNCAAVVETLFESELFGYVKGAFTGATQDKIGMFEYAHSGTLLLDEIGEMPLATQTKLLRVLQDQQIQRVGSPVARKVDVRVVAATHRDLAAEVAEKKFREALYYRLCMIEIRLPRLADRKEDLPLLERYFLERFSAQYNKPLARLTHRAQVILGRYSWPGNVRELENVLGHACMMVDGDAVDVRDLPERFQAAVPKGAGEDSELITLEEVQRHHALRVLERVGGNKVQAAVILGVSRATLYRLLAENEAQASE
jgi:transcriptional regulator with PAS, ATPase and Fis domain